MIEKLTRLLIKCGVTWFPKKLAEKLFANDVVIVTRCEKCRHCKEIDSPEGTVWYCQVEEKPVSSCGYCSSGEEDN